MERDIRDMVDTADRGVRVVHHTTRVAFPSDRGKARLYFSRLREGYDQFYCWNRCRNLYRSEMDFYCKHYDAWIAARNLAVAKNRHKERTVTARWLHEKARTCPEELTVQLTAENDGQMPDQCTFRNCVQAYIDWMQQWDAENGNCLHVLGAYIAKDTPCRAIMRRVWDYDDVDGTRKVGQSGALRQAGVPCPEEEAEESRYNNRKMTFDRYSREALYGFLEDAGVAVIREPRIYTLRQAEAALDEAEAAERDAAAMLKELMELEARAPQFNEDGELPGAIHENGKVKIPEEVWRLLKIRESLEGAYAARTDGTGKARLGPGRGTAGAYAYDGTARSPGGGGKGIRPLMSRADAA